MLSIVRNSALLLRLNVNSIRKSNLILKFNFSNSNDKFYQKIRVYKRAFAFGLFGVTFAVVYFTRNKRIQRFSHLFEQSERLVGSKFGNFELYKFKDFILSDNVLKTLPEINKFEFRETDVLISSFPKTGTTWLQEIIYLLMNNLNYSEAKNKNITDRFPYIEYPIPGLATLRRESGERLMKTHLPFKLIENETIQKAKLITIIRDPKDVLVSYYYFSRMNKIIDYRGLFDNFFEIFLNDRVPYGPVWYHYLDAINVNNNKDKYQHIIISFENLKRNFANEVHRLTDFLGKTRLNEDEMNELERHCNFELMKDNPSVNYEHWNALGMRNLTEAQFMRKGIVGDWKNHFTESQKVLFNKWLNEKFTQSLAYFNDVN